MRQLPFAGGANLGAVYAMAKAQSYELTHEQVLEICQALKFQADALDHQEGSRTEVTAWAAQAASLWRLIDKLVGETPSLRFLSPRSPEFARKPGSSPLPSAPIPATDKSASAKSIVGKNFLPAVFVILWTWASFIIQPRQTLGLKLFGGLLGGLLLIWIGARVSRSFRARAPVWAQRVGTIFYWLCVGFAVLGVGLSAFAVYGGDPPVFFVDGLVLGALYWVVGFGTRRALTTSKPLDAEPTSSH